MALTEGHDLIAVTATDLAAQSAQQTISVVLDTQPPALNLAAPAEGAFIAALSATVSGTVTDASPLALTVNGAATAVAAGGSFSITAALSAGANTIVALATDAAGNSSAVTRHLRANSVPPALTVSSPAEGLITNQTTIAVSGTATPGDSTDTLSVTIDGAPAARSGSAFSGAISPPEGDHTIVVIATDSYGLSSRQEVHITRDTTPPAIAISGVADSEVRTSPVTISFSATDAHLSSVSATLDGASFASGGTVSAAGAHALVVVAADAASNQATQTVHFSIAAAGVFRLGGTVTGLPSSLVLANGAEQLTVSDNGAFAFDTPLASGQSYSVGIQSQPAPPAQTCTVTNGAGVATADVTNVEVDCPPFAVASGLVGPALVKVNGSSVYFATSSTVSCYGTGTPRDGIMMVPTSGGTPVAIAPIDHFAGNCGAYGMLFDSSYLYWADYADATIWRATLAGVGPTQIFSGGQYLNGLAIDAAGGSLYYHQYGYSSIGRVSTAGSGNTTFASAGSINGENLTSDGANLYWTDATVGTVNQVPFSASPPASPTTLATGEAAPFAPFVSSSSIYWLASGALRYASLTSPSAASLATGLLAPNSTVADASSVWVLASGSGASDGRIYQIPTGGGAPVIIAKGLYQPRSLAQDASNLY